MKPQKQDGRWAVIPHFVNALAWKDDFGNWIYKTSCLIGRQAHSKPKKHYICNPGEVISLMEGWVYLLGYDGECWHFRTEEAAEGPAKEFCAKHGLMWTNEISLEGEPLWLD